MHQREDRGIRPDPQRNRKNDGDRKARRFAKLTERNNNVMHAIFLQRGRCEFLSHYAAATEIVQSRLLKSAPPQKKQITRSICTNLCPNSDTDETLPSRGEDVHRNSQNSTTLTAHPVS